MNDKLMIVASLLHNIGVAVGNDVNVSFHLHEGDEKILLVKFEWPNGFVYERAVSITILHAGNFDYYPVLVNEAKSFFQLS